MALSKAIPALMEHGVRVVAIGLEPLGVEEFVEGGFWKGELYVDEGKRAYKALRLQSLGVLAALRALGFNAAVKQALAAHKEVPGNLRGDGLQLGGTFVFAKGGALLLDSRQANFADHPPPEALLEAVGLDPNLLQGHGGGGAGVVPEDGAACVDGSCQQ